MRAAGASAWLEVTGPHFTLLSDLPRAQAEELTRSSEQLVAALSLLSPSAAPGDGYRLTLFAFATQEEFDSYALLRGDAGFLQPYEHGVLAAFVAQREALQRIHRQAVLNILQTQLPGLPEWFLHGVAEFYSTFRVEHGEAHVGLPSRSSITTVYATPLTKILAADRATAQHYADFSNRAWGVVHYLSFGDPALRQNLGKYLDLIRDLERPNRAFVRAFGITIEELEERVDGYLRSETISYLRIVASQLSTPTLTTRELDEHETALRLNGLLLHSNPRRLDDAVSGLERVVAARPDLPMALIALAEGKIKLADWDGALLTLRRATELDSGNPRALQMLGQTLLEMTRSAGDPEALRLEAVAAFERCTQLAPDGTLAWERLSLAYAGLPKISDRALEVGDRAIELLPGRTDLVFNLLLMRAKRGQTEAVRDLVQRLGALGAPPDLVTRGREMMLQLELQRARSLMRDDQLEDALAVLAEVHAWTTNESVRATADEWISEVESVRRHNEFVRRYNEAVVAYNASDYDLALQLLASLEPDAMGAQQKRTLGHLRSEVEYWRE